MNRFLLFVKKPVVLASSIGIAGFSGGLSIGYILGKRRFVEKVEVYTESDTIIQMEIDFTEFDENTEAMRTKSKQNHPSNVPIIELEPERTPQKLKRLVTEYEGGVTNVFNVHIDNDWDYERELSTRTHEKPYVIHRDEFWAEELDFTQITLTYYQADDILTDDHDVPIYNFRKIVGDAMQFGHGSGDTNVVYIRNEILTAEYEVLFCPGSYEEEVLGVELEKKFKADDLKHSARKFKMD